MGKAEEAFFAVWDLLEDIWNGFFKMEIFDFGFTFADVLFGLMLVGLSLYVIRFFAHAPGEAGNQSVRYKK